MVIPAEADFLVENLHEQAITLEQRNDHQDFVEVFAAGVVEDVSLCLSRQKNQIDDDHQTFELDVIVGDVLALQSKKNLN